MSTQTPPVNLISLSFSALDESPLQQLHSSILEHAGVQLFIKRDDLMHPEFGGNKWRKLKYNLIHAREQQHTTLLTFGGAWSNHIYATAAAGSHFGFKTIGIIRGEKHTPLNPTLQFAEQKGMQLHYVSRSEYRNKNNHDYLEKIQQQFGDVYLLPEGGSNSLATQGCEEIIIEIQHSLDTTHNKNFDIVCCACGTGATLAGLINGLETNISKHSHSAIGFSALKGGSFLYKDVEQFLSIKKEPTIDWHIEDRYHFGGYAKVTNQLLQFIKAFKSEHGIMLDAVYTGKMFYGLMQMIKDGEFHPGTKIVALHSGGLQGNKGFSDIEPVTRRPI